MDQRHASPDSDKRSESRGFLDRTSSANLPDLDLARARSWIALVALAVFVAVAAACAAPSETSESSESALAESGRWALPTAVRTAGAIVRVTYDEAPRWSGSAACAGKLRPGGHKLGEYLLDHFAAVSSVGGYACRRNTADSSRMSVHGTGRALDVFIPRTSGAADNGQGDKVANWLVMHAQQIGVQLVIWDRTIWRSDGRNDGAYGGPHPHDDHLHVELTNEAGALSTPWFSNMTDDTDPSTTADGGTTSDAANDSAPRVDAGTRDSSIGTPDAGDYEGDAAVDDPADDDHIQDEPDAASTTADASTTTTTEPSTTGSPSDGLESAGDAPGETNSLPDVPTTNRRKASLDDDSTPNAGCSAAPRAPSPLGAFSGTLALGLALAAVARRKRR